MPSNWTVVEPSLAALTFAYSFGPGIADALALCTPDGVIVVTPPCNAPENTFAELEKYGPIKALVAPNAYHNMGLKEWSARFPKAPIFAPAQSIERTVKKSKLKNIEKVADAKSLLGDKIELIDMPHYKTGEVLIRWKTDTGYAWFLTDVAMNFEKAPSGPFGLVARWTKSAPGFRRNAIAGFFMVKDKAPLYSWIQEQAELTPPSLIVMCHGSNVAIENASAQVSAAFT